MSANDQAPSSSNTTQESSSSSQDISENDRSDSSSPSIEEPQSSTSTPTTKTNTSESIFSLLSNIPSSLFAIVKRRLSEKIEQVIKKNHEQRERYYARMQERLYPQKPALHNRVKVPHHTQPTSHNRVQKKEPQVAHHTQSIPIQRKLNARQYARKINKEKAKAIALANSTSEDTQTDKPDKGKGRAMFDPSLPPIAEEAEEEAEPTPSSQQPVVLPFLVGDEDADYQRAIIESIKSEEARINRDRAQNSTLPTSYLFDVNNYSTMPFTTTKTLPWNQPLKFNEPSSQHASTSKLPIVSHHVFYNQRTTSTQNFFEPSASSQSASGSSLPSFSQGVSYANSTQNVFSSEPSTFSQSASSGNLPSMSQSVSYNSPTQNVFSNDPSSSMQSIFSNEPSTSSQNSFYDAPHHFFEPATSSQNVFYSAPSTFTQNIFHNEPLVSNVTQEEFVYESPQDDVINDSIDSVSQIVSDLVYTDNDPSPQPTTSKEPRTPSRSPSPAPPVDKKPAKRPRARSVSREPTRYSKRLKEKQEKKEMASTEIPRPVQRKRGRPRKTRR